MNTSHTPTPRGETRTSALAGRWFPADADELRRAVRRYLDEGKAAAQAALVLGRVAAVLAPHAGIVYSGPVAGAAWAAALEHTAAAYARVVLVGPAHRVAFKGIALGDYDAFAIPTGRVTVDRAALADLEAAGLGTFVPAAHVDEHCLEIELPFLVEAFAGRVQPPIVPLLVGHVDEGEVAAALERVLRTDDLLVISSDLSHFHPYEDAAARDEATLARVLALDRRGLSGHAACGHEGLVAGLALARQRGWTSAFIGYQNSGDTAGDKDQVVGYGAVAFGPPLVPAGAL